MIFNQKVLCVIPAKKNSSGIKRKNFKKIKGKPLYIHSIKAALKCKFIDAVIVSSDSRSILNKSKNFNVQTLKRSKKLSSNKSLIKDVIIDILKKIKKKFDILVLLQPTTPVISIKELNKCLYLIGKKNYSSIISIKEGNVTIPNLLQRNNKGTIKHITHQKVTSSNRQDFKSYYLPSGDFFLTKISNFRKKKSFYGNRALGFITKNKFSVDINSERDIKYLNFLLRN